MKTGLSLAADVTTRNFLVRQAVEGSTDFVEAIALHRSKHEDCNVSGPASLKF